MHEAIARECVALSEGNYFVGYPDLIENFDTLAALRGNKNLLFDLIDRPDWVKAKLWEINAAFFAAYDRLREIIVCEDGSSVFAAFAIWGPGRVAKVQCDASAMLSPDMFAEFVLPPLKAQCDWLDQSMFHLDGGQCLVHLDHLLAIDSLQAIEWTPHPGVPLGGDPHWYPLYRRILDAGKSVQIIGVQPGDVAPLLDAIGSNGVCIMTGYTTEDEAAETLRIVDRFRR